MKLTIKNLGPLTKGGSIDLDKRFYVFVGKNNSGKTYVANVMARLFDGSSRKEFAPSDKDLALSGETKTIEITKEWFSNTVQDLAANWLQKEVPLILNTKLDNFQDLHISLKLNSNDFEKKFLNKEIKFVFYCPLYHYNQDIETNIPDTYYYCITLKKNKGEQIFQQEETEITDKDYHNAFKNDLNISRGVKISKDFYEKRHIYEDVSSFFMTFLIDLILSKNYRLYGPNPIFLPANRAFLTSFWKYIYRVQKSLYDEMTELRNQGLNNDNLLKTPYTDATNDLIKSIFRLDSKHSTREKYSDLLKELEEIIGGKIVLKQGVEGFGNIDIQFQIGQNEQELSLDMYLASSSVNQLTILYLYLKYWAQDSHNFLIIDEPEENLHPENQVKLVNLLMKFADRNNNKVLITTHSSLVTEAVNNYVRIGYLKDKGVDLKELLEGEGSGLHQLAELSKEDFGVYYFGEGAIKEYEIDEFGVFFRDFAKIEDDIRNTANLLKDKIYKSTHPRTKKE